MVQLIVGAKGKGKTKILLEKAAEAIKTANGSVVYIDKSAQHMYELSNKIRLINISNFPIDSEDGYIGFVSGVISQDHDLEYLILDGFVHIANLKGQDVTGAIEKLAALGESYGVNIIVSMSMDSHELPESLQKYVSVAL